MAGDRYWIAAANADYNDTANWSTSSGGAGGASVPDGNDTAIFDGNGLGNCTLDINIAVYGFHIQSGYTGTITQSGGNTLTVNSNDFVQADGTFAGGSGAIDINGTLTLSAGTFTATSGTLTLFEHLTQTGGTFNHNNGTFKFDGNNQINVDVPGSLTLHDLEIGMAGSSRAVRMTDGDTLIATGDFSLSAGKFDNGTIQIQGDTTIGVNAKGGNGALHFTGGNNQTYTDNGGNEPDGSYRIDKSAGTLTLASNLDLNTSQSLYLDGGTLDLAGFDCGSATQSKLFLAAGTSLKLQGGETLFQIGSAAEDSTVTYNGSGTYAKLAAGNTYGHLSFDGTGSWTLDRDTEVAGDCNRSRTAAA